MKNLLAIFLKTYFVICTSTKPSVNSLSSAILPAITPKMHPYTKWNNSDPPITNGYDPWNRNAMVLTYGLGADTTNESSIVWIPNVASGRNNTNQRDTPTTMPSNIPRFVFDGTSFLQNNTN